MTVAAVSSQRIPNIFDSYTYSSDLFFRLIGKSSKKRKSRKIDINWFLARLIPWILNQRSSSVCIYICIRFIHRMEFKYSDGTNSILHQLCVCTLWSINDSENNYVYNVVNILWPRYESQSERHRANIHIYHVASTLKYWTLTRIQ